MSVFVVVLAVLVGVVVAIVALASRRPDTFRVERRIHIGASPTKVFELVEDFHRWVDWSPWEGIDPNLRRTYSGAERGVGASYAWKGTNKVGEGKMAIRETDAPRKVIIALDFLKPFEAHNIAEFTLKAVGETTEITWSMTGAQPLIGKVMGLFINMDKMVGRDFEKGLLKMKVVAEG